MPRERGAQERFLDIFLDLLDSPFGKTKEQLAEKYSLSVRRVEEIFNKFKLRGFDLTSDHRGQFRLVRHHRIFEELEDLLHFTEKEQRALKKAIDATELGLKHQANLRRKLDGIYDFRRLGHAYLETTHLTKLNLLEKAKREKRQALLHNYRSSSSGSRADRLVEIMHIEPEKDEVQVYDTEEEDEMRVRKVFRISRIGTVSVTDTPILFGEQHSYLPTDCFGFHYPTQRPIHLVLDLPAYNDLIDRFPAAAALCKEKRDGFHLQCEVNAGYGGVRNFLLGCPGVVKIVESEDLREHLREAFRKKDF